MSKRLLTPIARARASGSVSAVLTTEGNIVGENQRRGIRVIVNQDERRLAILSGY